MTMFSMRSAKEIKSAQGLLNRPKFNLRQRSRYSHTLAKTHLLAYSNEINKIALCLLSMVKTFVDNPYKYHGDIGMYYTVLQ